MTLTVTPAPVQPPTFTPPPVSITLNAGGTVIDTLGTVQPAAVQPAAIQPPAIVVTDAQMAAALQADGYTVTAPGVVVTPPPPPPPPPPTNVITYQPAKGLPALNPASPHTIIDGNGNLGQYYGGTPVPASAVAPAGDWVNDASIVTGQPATDGGTTAVVSPTGPWEQLLPHAIAQAGAPMPNGIYTDLTGCSVMILDVLPRTAIQQLSAQFFEVEGAGTYVGPNATVTDAGYPGGAVTIGNAANLPVGVRTRITVPLALLNWPLAGGTALQETSKNSIYKTGLQVNAPEAGVVYEIINWGWL